MLCCGIFYVISDSPVNKRVADGIRNIMIDKTRKISYGFFLLLAVLSLCWPLLRKALSNRKKAA